MDGARVTGPLQIRSDGQTGTISGQLKLNRGKFQLGRASAAADVPKLQVRDRGLDPRPRDVRLVGQLLELGVATEAEVGALREAGENMARLYGLTDEPGFRYITD